MRVPGVSVHSHDGSRVGLQPRRIELPTDLLRHRPFIHAALDLSPDKCEGFRDHDAQLPSGSLVGGQVFGIQAT